MGELLQTLLMILPAMATFVSVGIAYGVLKVKSTASEKRLNDLEKEALALNEAMSARVAHIATDLSNHKQDTTDRLARIETKLDILLSQR